MPVVVVRTNYPTGGGWTRGNMINRNYVDVTGPFKTNRQALRAASELREEPGKCFGDSPCMCIDEDDTKAEQKRKKQACTCWEQQGYADAPPWDSSSVWHGAGSTAECIEIMPQALHEDDVEEDAEFMAAGVDQPSLGVTSRQHAVHHAEQEKAANNMSPKDLPATPNQTKKSCPPFLCVSKPNGLARAAIRVIPGDRGRIPNSWPIHKGKSSGRFQCRL